MIPNSEVVKNEVIKLNGDSSSGHHRLPNIFFQECWDMVRLDIIRMVQDFFTGKTLPKSIIHTHIVLIQKKEECSILFRYETY